MDRINLSVQKQYIEESVLNENPNTRTRLVEARDPALKRTVVLKTICFSNASQKDLILREVQNQILLEKYTDFTPKIHNVFVDDREKKIVIEMQKMEGRSLREVIQENMAREKNRFWYDSSYKLFIRICESIGMTHNAKHPDFVHKDLKPENIIVNRKRNTVYVIDFSISGPGLEKDVGTSTYMAPEQRSNMQKFHVTQATDVFALGQIGIEMFTGSPLEVNRDLIVDTGAGKDQWLREKDISGIGAAFYPNLGAVLKKAIAMNPNDRYPDGNALADALKGRNKKNHGKR